MPTTTAIAGMCHICQQTVAGHRIRRHLSRCIPARVGLTMVQDPLSHISQRTAHISVRAPGKPHWLELGVRCDVTLRELDKFLRSAWLECCGHLSHFLIDDVIYSVMVPMPWEDRYFEPEYEGEENWRHMGEIIDSVIAPLTKFEYEFDYGTTTELELECLAVLGDLVGQVSPKQPWHGGKIVILGQNHSQQTCLKCQQPALWKLVAEYDEDEVFDYELYEAEQVLYEDNLDPITFCEECAPPEGNFIPLANSPRVGANCFDNTHSWETWSLPEYPQTNQKPEVAETVTATVKPGRVPARPDLLASAPRQGSRASIVLALADDWPATMRNIVA